MKIQCHRWHGKNKSCGHNLIFVPYPISFSYKNTNLHPCFELVWGRFLRFLAKCIWNTSPSHWETCFSFAATSQVGCSIGKSHTCDTTITRPDSRPPHFHSTPPKWLAELFRAADPSEHNASLLPSKPWTLANPQSEPACSPSTWLIEETRLASGYNIF